MITIKEVFSLDGGLGVLAGVEVRLDRNLVLAGPDEVHECDTALFILERVSDRVVILVNQNAVWSSENIGELAHKNGDKLVLELSLVHLGLNFGSHREIHDLGSLELQ